MHQSCQNGHSSVVELLVNFGGDINAATDLGVTPLILASGSGHKSIVQLLLRYGALANQTDINRYVHGILIPNFLILMSWQFKFLKNNAHLLEINNLLKPKNANISS